MKKALFLCGLLVAIPAFAYTVPSNDGFITDEAGVLSQSEEGALERTLTQYRNETSNEIAVLIVSTLGGEDPADVAVQVGREWGVGTEKDNGILLLIAYEDRDLFLATGYGLEGALPDLAAKGIIDTDIVPQFRDGNYFQGIADGIAAIQKHIEGEYTTERYAVDDGEGGSFWFIFVFIGLQLLGAFLGKSKSWWLGGVLGAVIGFVTTLLWGWWLAIPLLTILGLIFDFIVSRVQPKGGTRYWGGGGRGGGSGGFGGFSGGSFGGGGSGGSW